MRRLYFDLRFLCIACRISFLGSLPSCCSLKRLVFIAGIENVAPFFVRDMTADQFLSVENNWPLLLFALHPADTAPHEVSIPPSTGAVFVQNCPTCLHRELFVVERSTSSHFVSKPCTLSCFNCTHLRSVKSRRASPVPQILKMS